LPLLRRAKRRWLGWLRVTLAFVLLGANGLPLLAMPIVGPVLSISHAAGEYLFTVILFPWTLPYYIENIRTRASATASVIEIAYPIEIAGVRYAPVVRSVCGSRKMLWVDKGMVIQTRNAPVVIGREFVGQAGDAIIAIDQPVGDLCSLARHGVGRSPNTFTPRVYVLRDAADQTQSYRLSYSMGEAVAVDDIVLQRPEIARIETAPAGEIPIDAFWPMARRGDDVGDLSRSIRPYHQLAVSNTGCVQYVTVSLMKAERTKRTGLERILPAQRPAYCRRVLDGLRPVSLPRISPLA
jgi:hypothetical protein